MKRSFKNAIGNERRQNLPNRRKRATSHYGVTYAWKRVVGYMVPEGMEPDGLLQLLGTDYKFAVSFVILVIVLLIRPTGLFRGKSI